MALDVSVKIELSKPIGKVGSWFPLLYVVDTEATSATYQEYADFTALVTGTGAKETDELYKAANVLFAQENAPHKVAVLTVASADTTALGAYINEGWRQLIPVGTITAENIKTLSAYIETTNKMLFATVTETDANSLVTGQNALKNERTVLVVGATDDEGKLTGNEACAVVGATAGLEAGSFTYKNTIVKASANDEVTEADLTTIDGKVIVILEKAGDIVTSDGKTVSGEFIDIIDSKDYIVQGIEYAVQKVFNNNKKVPYTNTGISMLEAAVLGVLVSAYNNGMIATNDDGTPAYSVSFAMRSETSESDRATRAYPYGTFSFSLAGAIHTAEIKGTITV